VKLLASAWLADKQAVSVYTEQNAFDKVVSDLNKLSSYGTVL